MGILDFTIAVAVFAMAFVLADICICGFLRRRARRRKEKAVDNNRQDVFKG